MSPEQITDMALTLQSNIAIEDIPGFGSTVVTYPDYVPEEEQEEREENRSVEFTFSAFFSASHSEKSNDSTPSNFVSPSSGTGGTGTSGADTGGTGTVASDFSLLLN